MRKILYPAVFVLSCWLLTPQDTHTIDMRVLWVISAISLLMALGEIGDTLYAIKKRMGNAK